MATLMYWGLMYWCLVIREQFHVLDQLVNTGLNTVQHWLREEARENDESDEHHQ